MRRFRPLTASDAPRIRILAKALRRQGMEEESEVDRESHFRLALEDDRLADQLKREKDKL